MNDVVAVRGEPTTFQNRDAATLDLDHDQTVPWMEKDEVCLAITLATGSYALPADLVHDVPFVIEVRKGVAGPQLRRWCAGGDYGRMEDGQGSPILILWE